MYEVGEWIAGKYRVEHLLGRGGMAVVVAAEHAELRARVALKLLAPGLARRSDVVERFVREARVCAQLRSEHACRVTELARLDTGEPYMVMEMLDGRDLAHVLATDGPLPFATAADYVIQACDAIAEAHAAQIVHRDLKPANLFLTQRRDGEPLIKVLDFGVAKVANADDRAVTLVDDVMGSPSYMAPEQHGSATLADARSDVWSLGIILYELVSGRRPFAGGTPIEIAMHVAHDDPAPLHGVPAGFAAAIARCLDKQPRRRFQRVVDLVAALRPFTPRDLPARARPATHPPEPAPRAPTSEPDDRPTLRVQPQAVVAMPAVSDAPSRATLRELPPPAKVARAIAHGSNARIAVPAGWRPPHPQALPIPLPMSSMRAARPSTHPPLPPGMRLLPPPLPGSGPRALPLLPATHAAAPPPQRFTMVHAILSFFILIALGLVVGLYLGSDGLRPPAPATDHH